MEFMDLLSLAHEIGQWVIRLMIIPVLARENRPSVAWAWLALFAFVPARGVEGIQHLEDRRRTAGTLQRKGRLISHENRATLCTPFGSTLVTCLGEKRQKGPRSFANR